MFDQLLFIEFLVFVVEAGVKSINVLLSQADILILFCWLYIFFLINLLIIFNVKEVILSTRKIREQIKLDYFSFDNKNLQNLLDFTKTCLCRFK